MSDLTIQKLAELAKSISGKECALLVIGYYQQGERDGKEYEEEIKAIRSTISPYSSDSKRKEYIFYYKLWWNMTLFELDLQTCMLDLQCMGKQLQTIEMALVHEVVNYHNLLLFSWTPKIITEQQFVDIYNKERLSRLEEVIPLSELARYEAFHRLQDEGYFKKESYIDDADEKDEKWKQTVASELTRLRDAIKSGKLKDAKVANVLGWYHNGKKYLGQEGITAKSWYDYSGKLDEDFNVHLDRKGELVEWEFGRYAVAMDGTLLSRLSKSKLPDGEEHRTYFEKRLRDILILKEDELVLDFKEDSYKQLIFARQKEAQDWIQRLLNHLEVVDKIEKEIFGKKVSVNRLKDQAKGLIERLMEGHNEAIPSLLKGYNILRKDTKFQFTFKDQEKYRLKSDLEPEAEWVNETIDKLVELANEDSGYGYELKT